MNILEVKNLTLSFGGITAVKDLSFEVREGEIFSIIGPNGAGKSTVFNLLTGIYRPKSGKVQLKERVLSGLKPHRITGAGVARTFQNIRLFPQMTALENVLVGRHCRTHAGAGAAVFRTPLFQKEEKEGKEKAFQLLKFVGLKGKENEPAKNLSYGQQRKLEIARALASEPRLLLLDEPAAGLNTSETGELAVLLENIRQKNITQLVIEHDMKLIMSISHRILVMNYGEKIALGSPEEVRAHPAVIEAYLGRSQ